MRAAGSLAGACALVAVVLTAACGVGTEDEPRVVRAADVPFGLLDQPATTVTTAPGPVVAMTAPVSIFLIQQGRLVAATREVPSPPAVRSVLELLLAGPTAEEARAGLRSAIAPSTQLFNVAIDGDVVRVDLSPGFAEAPAQDQTVAVAQIVFTATGLPGIAGVGFTLAGRAVEVPTADGTLRRGTLTPADYATLTAG